MPKSKNPRGVYEKIKGSNDWYIRFAFEGRMVKEHVGMKSTAIKKVEIRRAEVTLGTYKPRAARAKPKTVLVREIIQDYLGEKQHLKSQEGGQLGGYSRFWLKQMGNKPIKSVIRADITKALAEKGKTPTYRGTLPSAGTLNRHLVFLKSVCNLAVLNNKLDKSPCQEIKQTKEPPSRDRWLNEDEERNLFSLLPLEIRQAAVVALHTGLRKTELFSLRWEDINFSTQLITVRMSKAGKKGHVPMNQVVIDTLKGLPHKIGSNQVFWRVMEKDPNFNFKSLDEKFYKAMKEASIEDFRWHDFRHTFASRMVMKGIDIVSVSKLMRHADIKMTMKYSHLHPDHLKAGVDSLVNWSQLTPPLTQSVGSSS